MKSRASSTSSTKSSECEVPTDHQEINSDSSNLESNINRNDVTLFDDKI